MRPVAVVAVVIGMLCGGAYAQSIAGDLLAGKLVDPKVGQWAWYDLSDKANNTTYVIRQAVVGEEKVAGKTGYWLEIEVVPVAGYKTISKMLLTGPASDPRNIHKVITKDGPEPPQTVEIPRDAKDDSASVGKRKSLGMDNVVTRSGPIRAEHVSVQKGERTIEVWMSEDVKPCGIVRVVSPEGEMILRSKGIGGADGKSVITDGPAAGAKGKEDSGAGQQGQESQPKIRVETKSGIGDEK
ncbi:MAG: hypothetical protein HZB26_26290 [Candidatus Hydrogenedentes bacterium]|nr:hypothetical protein [Candidatus Hydrogenedentota bacterium]